MVCAVERLLTLVESAVITATIIILFCACSWYTTHYSKVATVIDVTNNVVTVIDDNNNIKRFNSNRFTMNDKVILIMNTNKTNTTTVDDTIEGIRLLNK